MDATYQCQCPHPAHYDNSFPNPKGGPGHPAGQAFEPAELFIVHTEAGSRVFCTECIDECWAGVNLLDGATLKQALANLGPSVAHAPVAFVVYREDEGELAAKTFPRGTFDEDWCRAQHADPGPFRGTVFCTRPAGHPGPHVNHLGPKRAYAVWS